MPIDCKHHPPCGRLVTRWNCARRTQAEDAVRRGIVTVEAVEQFLRTCGLPMSPSTKAVHGMPTKEPALKQGRLV